MNYWSEARFLVAGTLAAFVLVGCSGTPTRAEAPKVEVAPPSPKPDLVESLKRREQQLQVELELLKLQRPDCFIDDINVEVQRMDGGRPSGTPKPIKPDSTLKDAIEVIRSLERQLRKDMADRIYSSNQSNYEVLQTLTVFNLNKTRSENKSAGETRFDELREVWLDMARCSENKFLTLVQTKDLADTQTRLALLSSSPSK